MGCSARPEGSSRLRMRRLRRHQTRHERRHGAAARRGQIDRSRSAPGGAAGSGRARHVVGLAERLGERRIEPFEVRLHVVQLGEQPLDAAGMARRPLRIGIDAGQFLAQTAVLADQLFAGQILVTHENSMGPSCVQCSIPTLPDLRGSRPTT